MNYADLITETADELMIIEKAQKLAAKQNRVRFLRFLKTGVATTQEQAGQMVGWKLRYSQSVWQSYRQKGLGTLMECSERWYFGKLSSAELARLQNYLASFGAINLGEVRGFIEQSFGVGYTIGGVSSLCRRLQIKLKTARPSNIKQDAEKVAAYKKTLVS